MKKGVTVCTHMFTPFFCLPGGEGFLLGTSGFFAPVEIPAALLSFAGFHQQVLVGTTLYNAFLATDSITDKGILSGRGCLTNVDIMISIHRLLLNHFV